MAASKQTFLRNEEFVMHSPVRILMLFLVVGLLLSLRVEAVGQIGRLGGSVRYLEANGQQYAASGARVIFSDGYGTAEARTDNNGVFLVVLPAGVYKVYAQGLAYHSQRLEVTGYVRANADNIVIPNPIYLVSNAIPGADLPLSRTAAGTEPPTSFVFSKSGVESLSGNRRCPERDTHDGSGFVCGRVVLKDPGTGRIEPKAEVGVMAANGGGVGTYKKTDNLGNFELQLPPGQWALCVVPEPQGFVQEPKPIVVVVERDKATAGIDLVLLPGKPKQCIVSANQSGVSSQDTTTNKTQ
jgi:hypothetical protein